MVSFTHQLKLLVWIETGLTSRREVAENLEGVSFAALIGVNPVFSCHRARRRGSVDTNACNAHLPFP